MGSTTKTSKEEVLEVRSDSGLTLKEHLTSICSKANKKLHALTTVSEFMSLKIHELHFTV